MTTAEQINNFINEYGPTIFLFAVALGFLFIVYKSWPLISNFVIVVNALVALPALMETVEKIQKEIIAEDGEHTLREEIKGIKAQIIPNGGASLRDAVDKVGKRLDDHIQAAENTERVRVSDRAAGTKEGVTHHES